MPKTTKKPSKQWVYSPRKPAPPKVSVQLKTEVERKAQVLIETYLKPTYVKPPPSEPRFNYIIDIEAKWLRSRFYFFATYAVPGPNAISPTFAANFARMTPVEGALFSLAFQRHTGEWIELYHGQTVEGCFETIQNDPWFQLG